MNFKAMAEENESWIIEQRRYFHAHPELSFAEKNTTQQIGKQRACCTWLSRYWRN